MSRAIHKMRRALLPISVLIENFGNIDTTTGTSVTFSSKAVGSGGGRTIIILATSNREGNTGVGLDTCTVGGTSASKEAGLKQQNTGDSSYAAIFSLDLTSQSGNVDIVFGSGAVTANSWGLSYTITKGTQSSTATDTATGGSTSTPTVTSTTLDGEVNGISVGVLANQGENKTHTWGSSLTEKTDVSTGAGSDDHRHTAAFDLLPAGRSASVETVTASSGNRMVLATATFR